jgi:serine/threonine protein kinase
MKKVRGFGHEAHMLSRFSEPETRDHPHNHCVPILDFFPSKDSNISLLVMPYLCRFNVPPLESVDEVVDFMQQTLEVRSGLVQIHSG